MTYLQVLPGPAATGLRQGLFARATLETGRKAALVVPASALRFDQARPHVLAVVDGVVRVKPVVLGVRGDVGFGGAPEAAVEVASGVAEGEMVLRGSVGALRDGTRVTLPKP
jgi:hypothetical protein